MLNRACVCKDWNIQTSFTFIVFVISGLHASLCSPSFLLLWDLSCLGACTMCKSNYHCVVTIQDVPKNCLFWRLAVSCTFPQNPWKLPTFCLHKFISDGRAWQIFSVGTWSKGTLWKIFTSPDSKHSHSDVWEVLPTSGHLIGLLHVPLVLSVGALFYWK